MILSYNHPRPRQRINPCLSKRAPPAGGPCMGNQPVAHRALLAKDPWMGNHPASLQEERRLKADVLTTTQTSYTLLSGGF